MTLAVLLEEIATTAGSVALAVVPLGLVFAAFQVLILRLPPREVLRIVGGTLVASLGLWVFLVGIGVGFLPSGRAIGEAVGRLSPKWLVVPFGLLLGFVTTWGEPAVRILADQVEDASAGSLRRSLVLWATCIGVAVAAAAGLFRISYGLPLLWLLVPGYGVAIAVMIFSEREFVGIAIDAGGVATGPLANTFLLALAFGAATAADSADPFIHGLGLVSLIALAPVLSLLVLGLIVRRRTQRATEAVP